MRDREARFKPVPCFIDSPRDETVAIGTCVLCREQIVVSQNVTQVIVDGADGPVRVVHAICAHEYGKLRRSLGELS